jgi:CAAX protease family protein
MAEIQAGGADETPLWRRIVDFPLVAMLIAILLYGFALTLGVLIFKIFPAMPGGRSAAVQAVIFVSLGWFTYKIAIRHLGERPRDDLRGEGSLRNSGLGLAAGLLLFGLVVGIAAIAGVYRIVGYGGMEELTADLFGVALMPAFTEELLFRGILFRWIEAFGGSWAALVFTSALFGLVHIMNPNATWFSSLAIALEAGVLLGGAYMLTRSLWLPMGLHAAWNFTQGFIFDVPVSGVDEHGLVTAKLSGPALLSGGQFGLEASVIAMVVATGAGLWLVRLAVKRGELVQPWWVRRRLLSVR